MSATVIAANWKMHKTIAEAEGFARSLVDQECPADREVIISPSATLLEPVSAILRPAGVYIAAQNIHFEEKGAFTGEMSAAQAVDAGATHVLVGHSERRTIFGETDEVVNKKLHAAQRHGLIPILCIGENEEQRETGQAAKVVIGQLETALDGLDNAFVEQLLVAYEPIWAIGTGKTATPLQAEGIQSVIKEQLPPTTRVLYGGSVKPDNAAELLSQTSVDGVLVGGASLEVSSFTAICSAK